MLKNAVLCLSILLNCAIAYVVYAPSIGSTNAEKMTCDQARREIASKAAVQSYSEMHDRSLVTVHAFLTNSDYQLRNIDISNGRMSFVYTSSAFYPSTCGLYLPGLAGGIVSVDTGIVGTPDVLQVW